MSHPAAHDASDESLTTGDLVILRAIELGMSLDSRQMRALALMVPNRSVPPASVGGA